MRTRMDMVVVALAIVVGFSFPGAAEAGLVDSIPNNVLWLDATDINGDGVPDALPNNTAASSWTDKSTGGSGTVTQGNSGRQPLVKTNYQNGLPVVQFDGSDDYMDGAAVLAGGDDTYSYLAVWQPHQVKTQAVYEQSQIPQALHTRASLLAVGNKYGFNGQNNDRHDLVPYGANQWNLTTMLVDDTTTPNIRIWDEETPYSGTTTGAGSLNLGSSGIIVGAKLTNKGENLDGDVAEIAVYSHNLNAAERILLDNSLAAKWDINLSGNDFYAGDTGANGDYDRDVIGIGQSAGAQLTSSAGSGLQIAEANSTLDSDGEFVLAGHKVAINRLVGDDAPFPGWVRWLRVWYLDSTGGVDVDLTFDSSEGGVPFAGQHAYLLYSATNAFNFSILDLSPTIVGDEVTFTVPDITLSNGYYTLGIAPEPTTLTLLALGGGLAALRRRRRAKA